MWNNDECKIYISSDEIAQIGLWASRPFYNLWYTLIQYSLFLNFRTQGYFIWFVASRVFEFCIRRKRWTNKWLCGKDIKTFAYLWVSSAVLYYHIVHFELYEYLIYSSLWTLFTQSQWLIHAWDYKHSLLYDIIPITYLSSNSVRYILNSKCGYVVIYLIQKRENIIRNIIWHPIIILYSLNKEQFIHINIDWGSEWNRMWYYNANNGT